MMKTPDYYNAGQIETIDKIEAITRGLDGFDGFLLGNIIKYSDRAGMKDADAGKDFDKANNYAHKLTRGGWRKADEKAEAEETAIVPKRRRIAKMLLDTCANAPDCNLIGCVNCEFYTPTDAG